MAVTGKKVKPPGVKLSKKDEHDCKLYVDTKWRLTTAQDWEPVLDYCQICGKVIHEYVKGETI